MRLRNESDTQKLAAAMARRLPCGSTVLLQGPLGAGKTTLVRHLLAALGFSGRVTSPSYTLMHTYPTPRGAVLHVDVYRLSRPEIVYDLGLEDAAADACLTLIEWGERRTFPKALTVVLEPQQDGSRRVSISAESAELQKLAQELEKDWLSD